MVSEIEARACRHVSMAGYPIPSFGPLIAWAAFFAFAIAASLWEQLG